MHRFQPTVVSDVTVSLSPAKAKELSLKSGDAVLLIGRRRKATYALVKVLKSKKSICGVSQNMATNLRLRNGDKIKMIPLGSEEDQPRTGDMILMKHSSPPTVSSVTFSPVEDSLNALAAREGGDELSDEEMMERFVSPYLDLSESSAMIKKNALLALVDDNGKTLEFLVTHVELEDDASVENDEEEGKFEA
jgi:hypothetical protein